MNKLIDSIISGLPVGAPLVGAPGADSIKGRFFNEYPNKPMKI
jgi:hypothetical protein